MCIFSKKKKFKLKDCFWSFKKKQKKNKNVRQVDAAMQKIND